MTTVAFSLPPDREIDAAVSAVLGQAPEILPFTTDERSRQPMKRWLSENGVAGDLSRMNNAKLCQNVMQRWLHDHVLKGGGEVQMMGSPTTRFVATNGMMSGWSTEGMDIAVARLVLMLAEPGYRVAVRAAMDGEEERDADSEA